jgi:hypothetical protein
MRRQLRVEAELLCALPERAVVEVVVAREAAAPEEQERWDAQAAEPFHVPEPRLARSRRLDVDVPVAGEEGLGHEVPPPGELPPGVDLPHVRRDVHPLAVEVQLNGEVASDAQIAGERGSCRSPHS